MVITFSEDFAADIFKVDWNIFQHTAAIWDGNCMTLRHVDIRIPKRTALCINRPVQRIKNNKVKGKVVPVYAMKAYRGSRGIAPFILNFVTRRTLVVVTPRPFYPRVRTLIATEKKDKWAPEAVWMFWRREISRLSGTESRFVQALASHYTDWATPAQRCEKCNGWNMSNRRISKNRRIWRRNDQDEEIS
jgi:hypothetical protein